MSKISPCIWYETEAEAAARFYCSLVPHSSVDRVQRAPIDYPGGKAGDVLVVGFTLGGSSFIGLNGGSPAQFSNAVSLTIHCEDQAEVDRVWDAMLAHGGKANACGWLNDRWGVPWQIVPNGFTEMLASENGEGARRAMAAMMDMVKLDLAALRRAFDGT